MPPVASNFSRVLAVAVLASCSACREEPRGKALPGPVSPIDAARRLAAEDMLLEAITALEPGVETLPASEKARGLLELARLYHRAGLWTKALRTAELAASLGAGEEDVLYLRGDCLRALERPSEAVAVLEKLLAKAADHYEAQLALARLRFRVSEAVDSLPLFAAYFARAPEDHALLPVATLEYGRALREARKLQEAADEFAALLAGDPTNSVYYTELSRTLYRMGLRSQAAFLERIYHRLDERAFEEHVEEGLLATGNSALALGQRAINRAAERRCLEAFRCYERALSLSAGEPRVAIYFARFATEFRRFGDVLEALEERLADVEAPRSGLLAAQGMVELARSNWSRARAAIENALLALEREGDLGGYARGQADALAARLDLAETLLRLRDFETGREVLSRIETVAADSPRCVLLRGVLMVEGPDPAGALPVLAKAARAGGVIAIEAIAWGCAALARCGRTAEAIAGVEKLPPHPDIAPALEALLESPELGETETEAVEKVRVGVASTAARLRELDRRLEALALAECGPTYEELGQLYVELRDPAAVEVLLLSSDLAPRAAGAARTLLELLQDEADYFVRVRLVRRLLETEPSDAPALRELSRLYLQLHVRLDEAEELARRSLEVEETADSFLLLAEAARLQGRRDEARKRLEEGRRHAPADPRFETRLEALGRE